MAGKGRGIIVTQAVKPGTLLAVGKPLGIHKVSVSECCAAAQLQLLCNADPGTSQQQQQQQRLVVVVIVVKTCT